MLDGSPPSHPEPGLQRRAIVSEWHRLRQGGPVGRINTSERSRATNVFADLGARTVVIAVDMGRLVQQTHYYVAVRAMDGCAKVGPIDTAQITTKQRELATVTPF